MVEKWCETLNPFCPMTDKDWSRMARTSSFLTSDRYHSHHDPGIMQNFRNDFMFTHFKLWKFWEKMIKRQPMLSLLNSKASATRPLSMPLNKLIPSSTGWIEPGFPSDKKGNLQLTAFVTRLKNPSLLRLTPRPLGPWRHWIGESVQRLLLTGTHLKLLCGCSNDRRQRCLRSAIAPQPTLMITEAIVLRIFYANID
ncbi:hypothetical protein LP7551_04565 [Roseibium album]|nr:hypothetical protein LP7551_04565 [Roseibium album]